MITKHFSLVITHHTKELKTVQIVCKVAPKGLYYLHRVANCRSPATREDER